MEKNVELETRLLNKYNGLLYKMALEYARRSEPFDHGRTEFEDLYQTVRLAFVELVRSGNFDESTICMGKNYYLVDQMYRAVRGNTLLSFPIHFTEHVNKFHEASMEEAALEPSVNTLDYNDSDIDVRAWINSLNLRDQQIIERLLAGETWESLISLGYIADPLDIRQSKIRIERAFRSSYCAGANHRTKHRKYAPRGRHVRKPTCVSERVANA